MSMDSEFTHKVWQESELSKMVDGGIPFPMLADTIGLISKMYGVFDEETENYARGRFLIDPDGTIQSIEYIAENVGRDFKELLRQIQALQLTRETGELTPAGWQPGKKTIKPDDKHIGNIWQIWKPEDAY